jgi:CheY-like chemotaxis protein
MIADSTPKTRILIVEDEPMIALDLQDLLVDAGFEVVGVAGRLEKALALIESTDIDAAVVDANLAGVSASPAAAALVTLGIPVVVLSGYSFAQQQHAFSGGHFLQKPCRPARLIDALNHLVLRR